MTTRLLSALATAIVLGLAAPTLAAETGSADSVRAMKDDIARAQSLVRQGRFTAALAILLPLVRAEAVDADALFLYGLASVSAADSPSMSEKQRDELLDEAIGAFHSMLVRRPELIRVRLELGRALFLKGEDALARRHFEQVLAGRPPAAVALNVNRFLNLIRARKRWSLRLGVALAPDSNIGASSDEEIIYINIGGQSLPFRLDEEQAATSGIGISAWLGGEYQLPLADRWRLRAGGDLSRKEYKESRFDQLIVSGHVGPRWLIGGRSEASLLLTGLHQWTGKALEDPSHHDVGVRLEGRHRLTRRTSLNARIWRYERRYDTEDHRDGPVTDVSLGTSWVASPTARIDAALGWGRERTELERFRNERRSVRVGATLALPWGFTVGGSGTLRWTDYEGNWSFFTQTAAPRKDITRTLRLFAHNRALTVQGFSPQVSVVREDRTSNAQLHGYERTFGELRFVRLF